MPRHPASADRSVARRRCRAETSTMSGWSTFRRTTGARRRPAGRVARARISPLPAALTPTAKSDRPGGRGTRPTRWRSAAKVRSSAVLSGAGGSSTSASSLPRSFDASALGNREREQQAVEIADRVELQRRAFDQRLQRALRIAALVMVDDVVRRPHPLVRGDGHDELAAGLELASRSKRARRGRRRYAR